MDFMQLEKNAFWLIQDASIGFIITNTYEKAVELCTINGWEEFWIEEFDIRMINDLGGHTIETEFIKRYGEYE